MRICLFDEWNGKFSSEIRQHWEELGHQIKVNPQWEAMEEADLSFFYQASNCAIEGVQKPTKGKIFVQAVDIEVWTGQANAVDWSKVDGAIFMAPHIHQRVEVGQTPQRLIKPGINLNKWSLRPYKGFDSPIRRIAYIVGDHRIWDVKRLDIAFQLLRDALNSTDLIWQLHIRGTYSSHEQYNAYCRYLQKDLGLAEFVVWEESRIEDLNSWLNDKDYFLLPSTKEAFSYATAETMAKGIKPILNNWEGSKETWGEFICNTYGEMLSELTKGSYEPEKYRGYVEKLYDQERYFNELDDFLGLRGGV